MNDRRSSLVQEAPEKGLTMDMLRWPAIHRMSNEENGSVRFLIVMESNGQDPSQRRASLADWDYSRPAPGIIYRADIEIPLAFRNDPEYIALMFTSAWMDIYKDTRQMRGAPEGAAWGWRRPSTGTWMQNVLSGVRSVLRMLGLMRKVK